MPVPVRKKATVRPPSLSSGVVSVITEVELPSAVIEAALTVIVAAVGSAA